MVIATMSPLTATRFADQNSRQEDDGIFFETFERIPSSVSLSYDDCRASFVSAIATPSLLRQTFGDDVIVDEYDGEEEEEEEDYSIWLLEEPLSIKERRQKLFREMGVSGRRSVAISSSPTIESTKPIPPPLASSPSSNHVRSRSDVGMTASEGNVTSSSPALSRARSTPPSFPRRGDSDNEDVLISALNSTPKKTPPRRVLKPPSLSGSITVGEDGGSGGMGDLAKRNQSISNANDAVPFYTITNLDTGKEFVINLENGNWNSKLCDPQTGDQLTMDEFEECVGHSPIVKELMRREKDNSSSSSGGKKKKKMKEKTRKGVTWLKNITGVGNNHHNSPSPEKLDIGSNSSSEKYSGKMNIINSPTKSQSDWMKVHKRGKAFKDLTGLYMSQEMKDAHQGSIWCIRFSPDALLMASAGEDLVIHVWQVLECDSVTSSQRRMGLPPDVLIVDGSPDEQAAVDRRSQDVSTSDQKLKKGKSFSSKGRTSIPDHVVVPETIFSLSEKPYCSFEGHQEDVLDLSWSKSSKYLLSSSMDKTVRLWDMETKTCLKLFKHNDYVTSIQFNPVDDGYFISGSLDAKARIWSIPDRQVIEWKDLSEMVTAVCYTPDGKGALVGTHNGTCRLYSMSDKKLRQKAELDLRFKKKKSQSKEITGFQFSPGNPSELLITSADSRIRVFLGVDLVYKFKGFRNTSKQIAAGFTPNAHYVVCASEDSHVYIWKREESRKGKSWVTTHAHERFHCKDVSVAVPWPGSCKHSPPSIPTSSSAAATALLSSRYNRSDSNNSGQEDPKKCSSPDRTMARMDEEICNSSQTGSNISRNNTSTTSNSWLGKSGPLASMQGFSLPYSSHLSARWHIGGSSRVSSAAPDATAWGLVVVTAGLGGEIRVHQNFGLPIRLNR